MMAPYLLRLVCLCLAVFFVIHSVVGVLVSVSGARAVRAASRMRPRVAGRFLLALRLLPATLAMLVVCGICVPSYLWLEPEISAEEVGPSVLIAAVFSLVLWTLSITRGIRAAARSARHAQKCQRLGRRSNLPGSHLPVWILDAPAPVFALVGLFRSGVVISSPVMSALSAGQLDAALRHEEAHQVSLDNLKRLLFLLLPGLLPGLHGFDSIERGWARFMEWAADDDAVAGNPHRSLSLAAALVCIARLGGATAVSPLTASFLGDSREISVRVDRLLRPTPPAPLPSRNFAALAGCLVVTIGCLASMLHPVTLESAHRLIEELIH